jgi:thiol-disulfide isomerase/thioredoxin
MRNWVKIIILFIVTIACKEQVSIESSKMEILLVNKVDNDVLFDPVFTDMNFNSYYNEFPDYYNHLSRYKNKPSIEISFISQFNFQKTNFFNKMYYDGFITNEEFDVIKKTWTIDTTEVLDFSDKLIAFTGVSKNKQIVIADSNNDKDFGNDLIQIFDVDFKKNALQNKIVLNKLPTIKYNYVLRHSFGDLDSYSRDVILFPSTDNVYASIAEDELNKKLHLIARVVDYWKGYIDYKGSAYEVVAQGFSREYLQILIKPDSLVFDNTDVFKNKNFEYKLNDTIKLSGDFFVIEDITKNVESILLNKISLKNYHGFRKGEVIKDLDLVNLDDSVIKLSSVNNKKFILLDFWGTWCPPCLKHMPVLKELQAKYNNELVIIGVASDDVDKINRYTKKENISWRQTYMKDRYGPNSIKSKLRIEGFPTYILLDNELNIIYRNTGISGFEEIEKIIETML